MPMELLEGIYSRRSVRQFTDSPVDNGHVLEIINAGTWAPSGLNNQPWRFCIIKDKNYKSKLAGHTKYGKVMEAAPVLIAVFLDKKAMYDETKDRQAIGACIQNMLLAAHSLGLGAVWLGEILKNAEKVRDVLGLPENLLLMAIVALGHPASNNQESTRKKPSEVIIKEI